MKKTVYTLFALSPVLYIGLFIWAQISPQIRAFLDINESLGQVFFGSYLLISLLAYFWDIWNNPRMPRIKRTLWTAVMFLGNWFAIPFYWWHYIRGSGSLEEEPAPNRVQRTKPARCAALVP